MKKCLTNYTLLLSWLFCLAVSASVHLPKPMFVYGAPKKMNLKEAIMLSVRSNPAVQSAYLQRTVDKFNLAVARNRFELQYNLGGDAIFVNGMAPEYRVRPGISWRSKLGTDVSLDFNRRVGGDNIGTGTLTVKQPLLRGAGYDIVTASLQDSEDSETIAQLSLKSKVMANVTEIISLYNKLVQDYKNVSVNQLALKDSLRTLDVTRSRIKAGKLAETEVTQQEEQIASQQLSLRRVENTVKTDYQNLLVKLGLDPNVQIQIEPEIQMRQLFIPDEQKCLALALRNNVEYQTQLISLRGKRRALKVARNEQLPALALEVSTTKELAKLNGNSRMALSLSVPINDKERQSRLVQADISLKQFELSLTDQRRNLETRVINAIRDLASQRDQIKLAEASVRYAEKSLQIARRKYEFGRTTMFEITRLRTTLTQNQVSLINERISYLNTFASFEQTLGITLDRWNLNICC